MAVHTITILGGGVEFSSVNEDVESVFNITIENSDVDEGNITELNITIPSSFIFTLGTNGTNATGLSIFTNQSASTNNNLTWINDSAAGLIPNQTLNHFWFNATPQTPGNFTIYVTLMNWSGGLSVQELYVLVNDTTSPIVTLNSPANITGSSNATIVFNATVYDNVNITNMSLYGNWTSSGTAGWHLNGTVSPSTNNSANAITVANISDGIYRWNFYSCDSESNCAFNTTGNFTLIIDTTIPAISFSCSSTDLEEGDDLTCTCTATDVTSVNPTVSYTASPSTASTGVQTTTCTATDSLSNVATSTISYTVTSANSGTSGSSSSSTIVTYSRTISKDSEELSEMGEVIQRLGRKERVKLKVSNETHYVGVKELTSSTASIEITSDPQEATISVGDERKFEINDDNFYDIYIKLNSIENSLANLTITSISEQITQETISEEEDKEAAAKGEEKKETESDGIGKWWLWVIGIIAALVIIGGGYNLKKRDG